MSTHSPVRTEYETAYLAKYGVDCPGYKRRKAKLERSYFSLLKDQALRDRGPACEACGLTLADAAEGKRFLVLHHIVHRASGGGDEPDNLMLLCGGCHSAAHDFRLSSGAAPSLPAGVQCPVPASRAVSVREMVSRAAALRHLAGETTS